jgi:hypothetical protein
MPTDVIQMSNDNLISNIKHPISVECFDLGY